jgi:hypothetical protein
LIFFEKKAPFYWLSGQLNTSEQKMNTFWTFGWTATGCFFVVFKNGNVTTTTIHKAYEANHYPDRFFGVFSIGFR